MMSCDTFVCMNFRFLVVDLCLALKCHSEIFLQANSAHLLRVDICSVHIKIDLLFVQLSFDAGYCFLPAAKVSKRIYARVHIRFLLYRHKVKR